MNLTAYEKKERSTADLTVEIEAGLFNSAVESVYRKTRGKISVPGFRPGKAPRKIIENIYGVSVFQSDALDELLPQALEFGIKEKELRTVGYPKLGEVTVNDDKSVTATFTVSLYPEIEIGEYRGLHASRPSVEIPESAIDSEIEALRLRNASIETVSRPAINGDTVLIDYSGTVDGELFEGGAAENYELELGSGSFIPGFEEKVQGMSAGETRDIDVVFPEEYHAEQLAGKPAVFSIKLHEVRAKTPPEADDEFAKDVSEFDTIAEYRADIRRRLEEARQKDADDWFENALLDELSKTVEGDIPEEMIEEQIDSSMKSLQSQLSQYGLDAESYFKMSGITLADYRRDMRTQSEKQVKVSLALEKIVEKEELQATDEQVEKFYAEMAEQYGMEVDALKKSIDEESAKREVTMRAAIKLVVENGVAEAVAEPSGEAEDAKKDDGESKPKRSRRAASKAKASDESPEPPAETATDKKEPAAKKTARRAVKDISDAEATAVSEPKPAKKTAAKAPEEVKEEGAPEKPKRPRAKKPAPDGSAE